MALCLPSEPRAALASTLRRLEGEQYDSALVAKLSEEAFAKGLHPQMLPQLDAIVRSRADIQALLGREITTPQYLFLATVYANFRNPDTLNLVLDGYDAARRSKTLQSAIPIVAAAALRNPAGTTFAPSPPSKEAMERILGTSSGFGGPRARDGNSAREFASIWLQGKWNLIKTQCVVCYGTPHFTNEREHQQCDVCGSGYCSQHCYQAHVQLDHEGQ